MPDLTPELLVYGFISYIVFLFSTTCHEAAHGLVAKLGGDSTAALAGQVTLNPVPHIRREPWGMVVIPILAFLFTRGMIGWASAPFDPLWEQRQPRRAALMALAGPAANFTLMFIAAAGLRIGSAMGWLHWRAGGHPDFAIVSLYIMLLMDEHTAGRYLGWLRTSSYARLGLLLGLLVFRYLYGPVESFAENLLLRSHF